MLKISSLASYSTLQLHSWHVSFRYQIKQELGRVHHRLQTNVSKASKEKQGKESNMASFFRTAGPNLKQQSWSSFLSSHILPDSREKGGGIHRFITVFMWRLHSSLYRASSLLSSLFVQMDSEPSTRCWTQLLSWSPIRQPGVSLSVRLQHIQ